MLLERFVLECFGTSGAGGIWGEQGTPVPGKGAPAGLGTLHSPNGAGLGQQLISLSLGTEGGMERGREGWRVTHRGV